jgi:hypothetical protein
MNILNIFNNLVTLSTLHSPTHSQTKQPQCSCKYNMYQHVAPTSQDNPPMNAASEESTADFLPKALQTGKKGDRAAETGRQKRAAETGRQKRGGRKQMPENGLKAPAAGGWHRKKPDKNTAKPNTDRKNSKPNTKIRKQRREARKQAGKARKQAGKARKQAEEPDAEETGIPKAKRIGQGQKKGNSESRLIVRHPQFPHQPKTTNLNEP